MVRRNNNNGGARNSDRTTLIKRNERRNNRVIIRTRSLTAIYNTRLDGTRDDRTGRRIRILCKYIFIIAGV